MLVISRKVNEGFVVGDGIEVTILAIRGNHVRIGIQAPKEVPVVRNELIDRDEGTQHEGSEVAT